MAELQSWDLLSGPDDGAGRIWWGVLGITMKTGILCPKKRCQRNLEDIGVYRSWIRTFLINFLNILTCRVFFLLYWCFLNLPFIRHITPKCERTLLLQKDEVAANTYLPHLIRTMAFRSLEICHCHGSSHPFSFFLSYSQNLDCTHQNTEKSIEYFQPL